MELIPFITLKNYNTINNSIALENISNYIKEGEKLYILDLDGIEKNKTNFELFKRLSSLYDLWIDPGPRNLGDVVDLFMIGATSITIRKNKYSKFNIADIRDISENKVYLNVDINDYENHSKELSFLKDFDGVLIFNKKEEIEYETKFQEFIKEIRTQNKIYFSENNIKNYPFWESFGINGLIVEINKSKEFKNAIGT